MAMEEIYKQEMAEYVQSAIQYLEMAMNIVECDDAFNKGQSEQLNKIYDKSNECIKDLESLKELTI